MECDYNHDVENVELESKAFLHEQLGLVNQSTNSVNAEEFSDIENVLAKIAPEEICFPEFIDTHKHEEAQFSEANTVFIKCEPLDEVDEDSTVAKNDVLVSENCAEDPSAVSHLLHSWYAYNTTNIQNKKARRRRRRSDLSRKTHNVKKQLKRVRNETEEQRAKRTSRYARWIASKRQNETLEQRAARLEKNRIRVRLRRKYEREALEKYKRLINNGFDGIPNQQGKTQEENDEDSRTRRKSEQPDNAEIVVDGTISIPEVQTIITAEEIIERRKINAQKALFRRHNETPEQRAARLERERVRVQRKRQQEDEKLKIMRRIQNAESAARRRNNASEEEKKKRKEKEREYTRRKREKETPEKREERLKRERIRVRQKRLLKKLERRLADGDLTLSLEEMYAEVDKLAQESEERKKKSKSSNLKENLETKVKSECVSNECDGTFSLEEMYAKVEKLWDSQKLQTVSKSSEVKEEMETIVESDSSASNKGDTTLCSTKINVQYY